MDDLNNTWPFFGLRVTTPNVTLAVITDALLPEVITLAEKGIHDTNAMPFTKDWALLPPPAIGRSMSTFFWQKRAELDPANWHLNFAVLHEGKVIGSQDVWAKHFPQRRVVETGSWLGQEHQGKGLGTEMRSAMLHLAFAGFGANRAITAARDDNHASLGVTRHLGYEPNGDSIDLMGDGQASRNEHFSMSREIWTVQRREDVVIDGLEPCLDMLGVTALD